ncbi:MAG TPA: glycoside hydrolase family 2 TIM barrel-domain containing protein [Ignavibacteriaceae bacterium]|nr:glycoside hydrolase family 2 TIM barrel-domain containing protein [Ignavibacteriaceae bacterium]
MLDKKGSLVCMKLSKEFRITISKIFLFIIILLSITTEIYSQKNAAESTIRLNKDWLISSSENIKANGSIISSSKYSTTGWYPASVPSTVLGTLISDHFYQDPFVGDNLKNIPTAQFKIPWWYRTKFKLPKADNSKNIELDFNGIIYRANIWLNGKLIAGADSTKGVYRRFSFNISKDVLFGKENNLAVEVFPPVPGEPSVGFVDWNPSAPDNNMGIWRDVKIKITGDASINCPFIQSQIDLKTLKRADLTISAEISNNANKMISGVLTGEIAKIKFSKEVALEPYQKKLITFTPEDFSQLRINNPRLWWTYNLGRPELYKLIMKFDIDGKVSDAIETTFGIREVSDYINKEGYRGYKLNGKKILILGGGWVDNLFLKSSYKNLKAQIDYVKQMGLNTIRLEGIWGENDDLYNLCDENGILIMAGWSCQWEWEDYLGKPVDKFGGIKSSEEISLISQSWRDQIKWLRNHPSIFLWLYGSDLIPRPELEQKYQSILRKDDPTRPFLASAAEHTSTITGKTEVKMRGPYDYVPPVYWWIDKKNGGAFGFNTEVGPGAEVPPLESIEKMLPKNHLWPIDSVWDYHCGKNTFSNLNNYNEAMDKSLGSPNSLEEYCTKAQFMNYENTRAMFEANEANKYNATGVIHWMLNAAWPKLWWQLYDYYLMPGGAFYGTKKACEPIHIMYSYGDNKIIVVNNTIQSKENLTAKVNLLNFDLSVKYSKDVSFNLLPDGSYQVLQLPDIKNLSETYFLDLRLYNGKKELSSNFYCLSTKPDELDEAKSTWFITPTKEYSNLIKLNKLKKVHLTVSSKFITLNKREEVEAELINNSSNLALQVVLSVTKGKYGTSVLPIFWEDNYISLLPGEKRIIKGYFYKEDLEGNKPKLKVTGWNVN